MLLSYSFTLSGPKLLINKIGIAVSTPRVFVRILMRLCMWNYALLLQLMRVYYLFSKHLWSNMLDSKRTLNINIFPQVSTINILCIEKWQIEVHWDWHRSNPPLCSPFTEWPWTNHCSSWGLLSHSWCSMLCFPLFSVSHSSGSHNFSSF